MMMAGGAAPRIARWFSAWSRHDPDRAHSHFGPVAVDLDLQGKGIGSLLLTEYCRQLDEAGVLSQHGGAATGRVDAHGRCPGWVVEAGNLGGVSALRSEITAYLRRHADAAASLDDCELVVSELITNGARHTSGLVWVSIDWSAAQPTIRVADIGPGFDMQIEMPTLDSAGGRGLFIVNSIVTRLESLRPPSPSSAP
jgi:anti-sigma regulatory factor (Ser/Thr protein kinase)